MDVTGVKDWGELRGLILESYRLIAPKKTLAKLERGATTGHELAKKATKMVPSRKSAARKTEARKSGR